MRNFGLLTLALVAVLLAAGQLARASSQARLPIVASLDWLPVWSPDGGQIAFTRISGRTFTLYVLDVDRHKTYRIAANQGQLSPSWSSDGRLAYSSGGKIWTANADGSDKMRVGIGYLPAWRPGSSDIASERADLYVNGTVWATRIIGQPAWSPDGTRLAFQRDDGIYLTTGPSAERKLVSTVSEPGHPVWSPDGNQIAFVAENEVWIVPADGSLPPKPRTPTLRFPSTPSWSHDGLALTYTANGKVWILRLDSGNIASVAPGSLGGSGYSPVGTTIAFSGPRPGCAGHAAIRIGATSLTGSCEIAGTSGNDVIDGTTAGGDVIVAGAGNDTIHANNRHRDTVNCGSGRDVVFADRSDVLRHCEIVHR